MSPYLRDRRRGGFSLLELIVTLLVMGVVAAVLAPLVSSTLSSWFAIQERDKARAERQAALERIVREVRLADASSRDCEASQNRITIDDDTVFEVDEDHRLVLAGEVLYEPLDSSPDPQWDNSSLCHEADGAWQIYLPPLSSASATEVTRVYPRNH